MHIIIKNLLGEEFIFEVEPTDTVEEVKGQILKETTIPPDVQRLFFKGIELEDSKQLSFYNIEDKCLIYLILRLRGGGGIDKIKKEIQKFLIEKEDETKSSNQSKKEKDIIPSNNIILNEEEENNIESSNIINQSNVNHINISTSNISITKKDELNEIKDEIDEKKELDNETLFSTKYLKRNELNVNLIHFDLNMTNYENYIYYNDFCVDVVGGFHAIDDLSILQNYLDKIKDKEIPFIVISSGTSGKEVIKICLKYQFIKEVIIFCKHYNYNEHYITEYPGYVKKVFTKRKDVYEYIKTFGEDRYKNGIKKYLDENKYIFSLEEINMDRQIQQCPLITSYQYDRCYFLIHKVYSDFFGDINFRYEKSMFEKKNLCKVVEYLSHLNFENENEKNNMINKFNNLANLDRNDQFIEKSIREYTSESNFCYLFNRVMRNFEKGLISFAYYMGPFLYGLNKYVNEHPEFAMSKKMKLYRIIKCSKLDFYQYKLNLGHIICFTSLTSTSSTPIKFKPSKLSQKTNENADEMMVIKMIFTYYHQKGNKSPGIIIEDKKLKDGSYLSCHPNEKEVLLFPFTFAKINKIKSTTENKAKIYIVELEIINRKSYIEYALKNDFENRILFYKLEQKK